MATKLDWGRPLVVCVGGPKNSSWFYRDDFEAMRSAAQRMQGPHHPRAAESTLGYELTSERMSHPVHPTTGLILRWAG